MCGSGLGSASEGLDLKNTKPDPKLRARPGLSLVGLKPRLCPKMAILKL